MKISWTKGLSPSDAKEVKDEYNASAVLRERLAVMLKDKQRLAYAKTLKEDAYESPNWGFKQADAVGYQRAIDEIIDLLS